MLADIYPYFAFSVIILFLCWIFYANRIEPRRIDIVRHKVHFPDLPTELHGKVICQVADVHLTAWRRNGPEIFDAVNSVSADVYVFTGDQIFKESGIDAFWEWFDRFGGKLNPCVMILGNAENKPNVRTSLFEEQAINRDIPLLNNMTTLLRLGDSNLQIVGTNDPHTFRSHIQSAYDNADPDLWTLLLIHSPDGVSELNGRRADLILCGHTHGGQICLPGIGPLGQNTRRVRGLVVGWYSGEELKRKAGCELGEAKLYVCRGLGMSRIALRSGCRPELALFELRRKD